MEDEELDELTNLIDVGGDDFDSDDEFIAQLNKSSEQCDQTATQEGKDVANTNSNGAKTDTTGNNKTSPEIMSRKMTEMQKYIKFLETQLKTKNDKKKISPENKSSENKPANQDDKCESASTTKSKSFYNQSTPASRSGRKENSTNQKQPEKSTSSQSSSDGAFVKKPRVAHTPKASDLSSVKSGTVDTERKSCGRKRKAEEPAPQTSSAKKLAQETAPGITDGYSGLRIVNPLISSTVMERRMEGRRVIKISSIQSKVRNNDIEGDWVTIGVLIQKLPGKTTAKGEPYSIWKLSDLAFNLQNPTISLFLFGQNHKEHWKTIEGSVVALLNPSVLPPREKQTSDVALSLDNPKKLMMVGMSQDFGVCQSTRKSDGARCSKFINKAEGNFCEYHVKREYSKTRAKRMECQQGYGAPSKFSGGKLREKVASESFFYGGKTVSSHSASQSQKEKVTLKSLGASSSGTGKDYLASWKEKQGEKKNPGESSENKDGPSEDFLSLLNVPTVGSRNLKLQLHKEEEKEVNETRPVLSASEFLKANKLERKSEQHSTLSAPRPRTKPSSEARTSKDPPSLRKPVLGRGLDFDGDIIFDENVPLNMAKRSSSDSDKAKKRALAIVREVGPFTAKNPNDVRAKKPLPKLQETIKNKIESDEETLEETVSNSGKTFSLAEGFSLDSEEGRKILKARSRHVGEVRQAENDQEQAYFSAREKKEEMETKMLSVKELKVKVVQCLQCKYVAEGPGAICKKENHNLTSLYVMKKFFSCRDCSERTVVYGQRYPTHECRKCGAKNYEKCAMWKEKSGPKIGRETLLLRGPEYAKFLNSLQTTKTNGILPKYL